MFASTNSPGRNTILSFLAKESQQRLAPLLQPVSIAAGDRLATKGALLQHAFFLGSGFASSNIPVGPKEGISVAMIGSEGIVCAAAVLKTIPSPFDVTMQIAGSGFSISAGILRAHVANDPALRSLINDFTDVLALQIASTAIAGATQKLIPRLARLLLMIHDRVEGADIWQTHDQLACMLAVRRAGITDAINTLEGDRILKAERAHITIRDRAALASVAGDTYGVAEDYYETALGISPRRAPETFSEVGPLAVEG